jgi:glc operon protein GlcG
MPEPYGMSISLDSAQKAAAAAIAAARKNGWLMAVAITDPSGELVYFAKMDGTQTGSVNVSIGKSRSAALFKRPTKVFQDMLASGGAGVRVLALERAVPIEGGVPLVINGEIVGGIGASGGSSDQDGVVAGAGAAALNAGS